MLNFIIKTANAAADPDLQAGLASTTLIFTDNKGSIIIWVVGIFAVTIVVGLLIKALFFGKSQALGMFGNPYSRYMRKWEKNHAGGDPDESPF